MARDTKVYGSGIEALSARLRRVATNLDDLTDLGRMVRAVIVEGNKDDRLAGRNRFGHRMPAVSPKLQQERNRRGRGKGPYLAPGPGRDPRESRTIANYFTRLESHRGMDGFRLSWGWRAIPWLRFWNAQARTDISGISPATGRRIGEVVRAHMNGVFER